MYIYIYTHKHTHTHIYIYIYIYIYYIDTLLTGYNSKIWIIIKQLQNNDGVIKLTLYS